MTHRTELLDEANQLITQDRNNQYGPPDQDFTRTAQLWATYLNHPIQPHDVAALMILLKMSRISWQPENRDSWVDIAGYAACGYETQIAEHKRKQAAENVKELRRKEHVATANRNNPKTFRPITDTDPTLPY